MREKKGRMETEKADENGTGRKRRERMERQEVEEAEPLEIGKGNRKGLEGMERRMGVWRVRKLMETEKNERGRE